MMPDVKGPWRDEAEILLRLYEQSAAQRREFERVCELVASFVVAMAVATTGLMKLDETEFPVNIILSAVILLLGWLGLRITNANCEGRDCQREIGKQYLGRLEDILKSLDHDRLIVPFPEDPLPEEEQQKKVARIWRQIHWGVIGYALILSVVCLLMHPPSWNWIKAF